MRLAPAFTLAAALSLSGCQQGPPDIVNAEDYDTFFLWAGVSGRPVLDRASEVYLLSGEVRAGDNARIVSLRPGIPRVEHAHIWLTLRVERIDWDPAIYDRVFAEMERWEKAGNRLNGLQIDFDAATLHLDRYAMFLADLRARLPERFRLSVTGLMDWSANGDPAALGILGEAVDEVVVQTYQDRSTIPGYEDYLESLQRHDFPYRIGIIEHGEWRAPSSLADDPQFRGYVVFLLPGVEL